MRPVSSQRVTPRILRFVRGIVAMGIALSLSGCLFSPDKDPPKTDEPVVFLPQTSPENVLENLITAYEQQNYDEYVKLFDETFFFAFDPVDVEKSGGDIPIEWGKDDDIRSTRNMFDEPLVEKVTLDFVIDDPEPATSADEQRHTFPLGTMKVTASEVELQVDTRDPEGGENIIYEVSGDQAIFFLYPHPTEKVDGLAKWYIVEWRDRKVNLLLALL